MLMGGKKENLEMEKRQIFTFPPALMRSLSLDPLTEQTSGLGSSLLLQSMIKNDSSFVAPVDKRDIVLHLHR